ncbi:hypothetical protein A3765_02890 [Oleiphilus sp. HI0130]|nr:hypothetical protein A3765_02890 [Oleiphilus sp. HI0130]
MFSREQWYEYLNEPSQRSLIAWLINLVIAAAIFFNMVEVLLVSVENEANSAHYSGIHVHAIFTFIFVADYLMRIWVAAEAPQEHGNSALNRRLNYVFSPMGVIDLLSFLPGLMLILVPDSAAQDFSFLKVMTTVRILKLTRYSASLSILAAVYRENFSTLFAAMIIMIIISFTAATGVYIFERVAQPEAFGSIPRSMWWALVTLTTVGYGDVVPITLGGKLFGAVVMIAGVGIAAIPAGVFASSFVRLIRDHDRKRRVSRHKRVLSKEMKESLKSIDLNGLEKQEVEYLMHEYGLTLEQAINVVDHYRS